jgi:PKD repeat protein
VLITNNLSVCVNVNEAARNDYLQKQGTAHFLIAFPLPMCANGVATQIINEVRKTKPRIFMRTHPAAFLRSLPAALFMAMLMLVAGGGTKALAQVVTNTADSGPGTLRYFITNADPSSTITFAPDLSGQTILLASTLVINNSLTVDASALTDGIQINGNGSVQIFNVASGTTDVLNSLTITNGYINADYEGSGICNDGTLTLNQCTLSGNNAGETGGGIYNDGIMTVSNCTLSGNSAGLYGGGIANDGTMTVNESTLSTNSAEEGGGGGGIVNAGTLTVNQCILTGNYANGYEAGGGGIYSPGPMTMNQSTLSGNYANGEYDQGGGIYIGNILNNTVAMVNRCSLSGNIAYGSGGFGGGIYNDGTLTVNECTLSGNNAEGGGGGIVNGVSLSLTNTIVAENNAGSGADIASSSFTCGGANIVQNYSGTITGPTPINADPELATLGNYGGPTQTMPPLPGSPAIGAGSLAGNTFATDQRGYPRTQNGLIDIGAVELPTVRPFTANPTNDWMPVPVQFTSTNVDSDGSAITQWNWSFGDNKTSAARNALHTYATTGGYAPSLIVTNSLGLTLAASGPAISTYPALRFQSFTRTNGGYQFSWNTSTLIQRPCISCNTRQTWSRTFGTTWAASSRVLTP